MKIAYSFLIGDLLHAGHIKMLEIAKNNADYHICGLLSDAVVDEWIDPKLCDFEERKSVLANIRLVDEIVEQQEIDPTKNLEKIRRQYPDATIVLVKNHMLGKSSLGVDYIHSIGGETLSYEFYPKLSRENIAEAFHRSLVNKHGKITFSRGSLTAGQEFTGAKFGTKANTLQKLKVLLTRSLIEREYVFTVKQWHEEQIKILEEIRSEFAGDVIVVRSSSLSEDLFNYSNAGHFHSVLNVKTTDHEIVQSVEQVIESYKRGKVLNDKDQILVQRQTDDVSVSGVIFTRNLMTNTPYYLVNYDDTGSTDAVTAGEGGKKIEIVRTIDVSSLESKWRNLVLAVQEIESIFQNITLDIEFAIKRDDSVVIFQVRPLAANSRFYSIADDEVVKRIQSCRTFYDTLNVTGTKDTSHRYFSDMAFWNPAELIGDRPKTLDYSLFNHLIMKREWSKALKPLGYTHVDDALMVMIANKPYIDLNYSFLTLTPDGIPAGLRDKLLRYYNGRIKQYPHLHDKIEFEIVLNCYRFDFENIASGLHDHGFTTEETFELRESLRSLSISILTSFGTVVKEDDASIARLDALCEKAKTTALNLRSASEKLDLVFELIEQCKTLGIPQFVRAARCAFIGNALLKSLVATKSLSSSEYNAFLNTIPTVASELDNDFRRLREGEIDLGKFLGSYWHLRPGTYDITKLPYEKNPSYFQLGGPSEKSGGQSGIEAVHDAVLETKIVEVIDSKLKEHGVGIAGQSVVAFIKRSIQLREYYKFVYTKAISLSIESIAEIGEQWGFTREDLAYLDYYSIVNHRKTCTDQEVIDLWRSLIGHRKQEYLLNSSVSLPPILFGVSDFTVIQTSTAKPNFITEQFIIGDTLLLDKESSAAVSISDRIVVIEKADPGYDWIFTHKIKGLITKYGGAASHMAIRCAEFNIPAAIGCGEIIFTKVMNGGTIALDCKNKTINIL